MSRDLTIGEAAKAVGLSVDAVRFYERQASWPRRPATRVAGGFTARNKYLNSPLSPAAGLCACRYSRSAAI